ncbi:hypothetical protein GCM10027073_38820 [Streptomyces chlorus]
MREEGCDERADAFDGALAFREGCQEDFPQARGVGAGGSDEDGVFFGPFTSRDGVVEVVGDGLGGLRARGDECEEWRQCGGSCCTQRGDEDVC